MKLFNKIIASVTTLGASLIVINPALANKHVKDNLNAADMMFANNMDGCPSVTIAVMAYNSPETFGQNTVSRSEVARYARRCNLRF